MLYLNPEKAGTFQDIPPKILKNSINVCSETLKNFFNDTIIHCEFPNELKKADVKPIFKKDDPTKAKNYRPVSVLQVVSKVFERIMHKQISEYSSYRDTCVAIDKVLVHNKHLQHMPMV